MPKKVYVEFPTEGLKGNNKYFEALLSNNPAILEAAAKDKDLSPEDRAYFAHRAQSMKKINDLIEKKDKHNGGKEKNPIKKRMQTGADGKKTTQKVWLDTTFKQAQTTGYGCWSVSLSNILKYHGIELSQREVRDFRPAFTEEKKKSLIADRFSFGDRVSDFDMMNGNEMGNTFLFSDLVLKTIPNTGVRDVIYNPVNDINRLNVAKDIINIAFHAINDKHEPVSILANKHYMTIYGVDLKESKLLVADSDGGVDEWRDWDRVIQGGKVEITWLEKLNVTEKGKVEGLPKGFTGISYRHGEVEYGPGYNVNDSNLQIEGAPLSSGELLEKRNLKLYVKREQYMAPTHLTAKQEYLDAQEGTTTENGKGEKVLDYDKTTSERLKKEFLSSAAALNDGNIYRQMYEYAVKNNIKISLDHSAEPKTFADSLSRYIAIYTNPKNRESSTYYNRLTEEIWELLSYGDMFEEGTEEKKLLKAVEAGLNRFIEVRRAYYKDNAKYDILEILNGTPESENSPYRKTVLSGAVIYKDKYGNIAYDIEKTIKAGKCQEKIFDIMVNSESHAAENNPVKDITDNDAAAALSIKFGNVVVQEKEQEPAEGMRELLVSSIAAINYNDIEIKYNKKMSNKDNYKAVVSNYTNACYNTVMSILDPETVPVNIQSYVLEDKLSAEELKDKLPMSCREYADIIKSAIEIDEQNRSKLTDLCEYGMNVLYTKLTEADEAKKQYSHYCMVKAALSDGYKERTSGPAWAAVLKNKPGITANESQGIDKLAFGPEKDTAALLNKYIAELTNMPGDLYDKFTPKAAYDNYCADTIEYYGQLAANCKTIIETEKENLDKIASKADISYLKKYSDNILKLYEGYNAQIEFRSGVDVEKVKQDILADYNNFKNEKNDEKLRRQQELQKAADELKRKQELEKSEKAAYIQRINQALELRKDKNAYELPSIQLHKDFCIKFNTIKTDEKCNYKSLDLSKETYVYAEYNKEICKIMDMDNIPGRITAEKLDALLELNHKTVQSVAGYANDTTNNDRRELFSELVCSLKLDKDIIQKAKEQLGKEHDEPVFFDQLVVESKKAILDGLNIVSERINTADYRYNNNYEIKTKIDRFKAPAVEKIEKHKRIYWEKKLQAFKLLGDAQRDNSFRITLALGKKLKTIDDYISKKGLSDKSQDFKNMYARLSAASKAIVPPKEMYKNLCEMSSLAEKLNNSKDKYVADFSKHLCSWLSDEIIGIAKVQQNNLDAAKDNNSYIADGTSIYGPQHSFGIYNAVVIDGNTIDTSARAVITLDQLNGENGYIEITKEELRKYKANDISKKLSKLMTYEKMQNKLTVHNKVLRQLGSDNNDNLAVSLYEVKKTENDIFKSQAMELFRDAWQGQTRSTTKMKACFQACEQYNTLLDKLNNKSVEQLEKFKNNISEGYSGWSFSSGVGKFDTALKRLVIASVDAKIIKAKQKRTDLINKSLFRTGLKDIQDAKTEPTARKLATDIFVKSVEKPLTETDLKKALFTESISVALAKKGIVPGKLGTEKGPDSLAAGLTSSFAGKLLGDKDAMSLLIPHIIDGSICDCFKFTINKAGNIRLSKEPDLEKIKKWAAKKKLDSIDKAYKTLKVFKEAEKKCTGNLEYAGETMKKGIEAMELFASAIAPKEIPVTSSVSNKITSALQDIFRANIMRKCINEKKSADQANKFADSLMRTKVLSQALELENLPQTIDKFLTKDGINALYEAAIKNPSQELTI